MTSLRVGDAQITRVEESYGAGFRASMLMPRFNLDAVDNHGPDVFSQFMHLDTHAALLSVHTWLVRTPRSVVLVDTCTGNHKHRPSMPSMHMLETPYLERLAAAGVAPEDVDFVVSTHLHIDHVGFNTTLRDGRWVPTFPNAKYIFHKWEYAAWEAENARGANPPGTVFRDNCLPIVEAGQALLVDDDYALDDTVTLTPTPGHSPCHCCVNIVSKGQRAVVAGDLVHHVIQCREVDW